MTDILAAIDAVIEDRCEHCGETLGTDAASGWFCSAACQRAWSAGHAGVAQLSPWDADESGYNSRSDAMIWDPNHQERKRIWREELEARQREAAEQRAREERERRERWERLTPVERAEREREFMAGVEETMAGLRREVAETINALAVSLAPHVEEMKRVMAGVAEQWNRSLAAAGVRPTQPSTDTRERALEFVRNRNTGPKLRKQRAPRSIEPRRGR